jgi:Arc/MetJ-type ribon-helix-helix transcriptional regulator
MTKQIPLRISDRDLSALDDLIARGRFASRSSALRAGLDLLLRTERERALEEAYRRGYEAHPQETRSARPGWPPSQHSSRPRSATGSRSEPLLDLD